MKPRKGGGYGVLGRGTELNFAIEDETKRENLKREILVVATDESFLRDAGFEIGETGKPPEGRLEQWLDDLRSKLLEGVAEWWFYDLLRRAEVVGSGRGGAAGCLKVAGAEGYKLRIAIQPEGSYGFLSRRTIIKHELGHFVREAKVMAHGRWWVRWRLGTVVAAAVVIGSLVVLVPWWVAGMALYVPVMWFLESKSLFEQERRQWCYLYNLFVVMPREEWLVWWFTMPNGRWRLGMVFALTMMTEVVVLYATWVMRLALGVALTWVALGVVWTLILWCLTLIAWRR